MREPGLLISPRREGWPRSNAEANRSASGVIDSMPLINWMSLASCCRLLLKGVSMHLLRNDHDHSESTHENNHSDRRKQARKFSDQGFPPHLWLGA
jgi:hypothetical protein